MVSICWNTLHIYTLSASEFLYESLNLIAMFELHSQTDIYGLVSIANILTSGLAFPYTVIVWFSVWFRSALSRAGFFLAPDEKAKCTKLDPTKLDDYCYKSQLDAL